MLEELIQICKDNNYVKPCVYQGQYNVICRRIETTLFPVLRANGMVFAAFRFGPLAAPFYKGGPATILNALTKIPIHKNKAPLPAAF